MLSDLKKNAGLKDELEALESKLVIRLIAYREGDDSIPFGLDVLERLEGQDGAGVEIEVSDAPPVITDRDADDLRALEDAFAMRLVGYHPLSDSVVWGQDLITALAEQHGIAD